MSVSPAKRVERAAARRAAARLALQDAIIEARESGMPWAAIAKAAGLSIEGVRKIARRAA